MEILKIENLTFYYPEQAQPVLKNISFSVQKGEFLTICGPSGCGKSTLLRQLKTSLSPHGIKIGEIIFDGKSISDLSRREEAVKIGFVQQSPENQIVTDKVWHELAFGLESLGYDAAAIRVRVAEMASFFGIQNWFYKNTAELSGGQKQLMNVASIMAMQPSMLILDEPTSQLDPIAASDFLATIGKINRELGVTVIMTEHRLDEAFPLSDRVLVMDNGEIIADGISKEVGTQLKNSGHGMFLAMPAAMRVWASVTTDEECPVSIRDGRKWMEHFAEKNELAPLCERLPFYSSENPVIELKDVRFRYEKDSPDVLKGITLKLKQGELYGLLGGNGTGKSTTLFVIGGLKKPYQGKCRISGFSAILPQNPQTLFVKKTVKEDLWEIFQGSSLPPEAQQERINNKIVLCKLEKLLNRHPYDLSGGEQQRLALAKVLLTEPDILLLDEPTKGLDAEFKKILADILKNLQEQGISILMVSHDVEFCAEYCDRCGLLFDGSIVTENEPRAFFSGNSFYTTAANRIARGIVSEVVTVEDAITVCGGKIPTKQRIILQDSKPQTELDKEKTSYKYSKSENVNESKKSLPLWRKVIAGFGLTTALLGFFETVCGSNLSEFLHSEGLFISGMNFLWMALIVGGLCIFAAAINRKSPHPKLPVQLQKENRKLSKRTIVAAGLILLLIPLTLFVGIYYFDSRRYYFFSLVILLETMLPFFLVFEGSKPQARELVVIAVLCAIGIVGRAAFFMLPNFKPVIALVIISGVAFGGESGFLVGAMTMLCSNIMFGQGPWTPWQMFAMGIIGFLAGICYRRGHLQRSKGSLCAFGAISAIVIYGGIMNPASALIWTQTLNKEILISYYLTGLPMDLIQAASTVIFLWFAAEPMLEKLNRIKIKYGLIGVDIDG